MTQKVHENGQEKTKSEPSGAGPIWRGGSLRIIEHCRLRRCEVSAGLPTTEFVSNPSFIQKSIMTTALKVVVIIGTP
jgi:hypothetical protein